MIRLRDYAEVHNPVLPDSWLGCYRSGWSKSDLVPEAFAHPGNLANMPTGDAPIEN